jgi:hypothetical protein
VFKLAVDKKLSLVENNIFVPGPGTYNTISDDANKHGVKFGSQKRMSL